MEIQFKASPIHVENSEISHLDCSHGDKLPSNDTSLYNPSNLQVIRESYCSHQNCNGCPDISFTLRFWDGYGIRVSNLWKKLCTCFQPLEKYAACQQWNSK